MYGSHSANISNNMKKAPKKKSGSKSKPRYEVMELPSDNNSMEQFVADNRPSINEKIVHNIEYALKNKLPRVELFCFENSDFVVVLNRHDFRDSLEDIFEFSLNNEHFEICAKVKNILSRLDKMSYVYTYKKNK